MAAPQFQPPALPPGKDKHHIVVLEAIHVAMPSFDFPHTITRHPRSQPEEVAERIKDATIVIACVIPVLPEHLAGAPYLRCLSVMAVGIGWVDKPAFARAGITVTNCRAGNVDAVVEHTLGLYFATRKRIVQVHNALANSAEWQEKGTLTGMWAGPPRGAHQEVLGIVGFGTLGTGIERVFRAVGFREVLVAERKAATGPPRDGRVSFADLLERATVVVVCVPKEPDTVDLISTPELQGMRRDAVLINVARGGIVNEAALATALREGWIEGAATDVLETEPGGVGSSPLLPDVQKGDAPVPNLTVSSHIAWFTQQTIANYQRLLKEGVEGFVNGTLQRGDDEVHDVVVVHGGKVWR